VHSARGEVEVENLGEQHDRVERMGEALDVGELVLGHGLRLANHAVNGRGDLHLVGVAPEAGDLGLEAAVATLGKLEVGSDEENQLAPARGQALASTATSRLDDDGMSLRCA